jgi:hypothetical protein
MLQINSDDIKADMKNTGREHSLNLWRDIDEFWDAASMKAWEVAFIQTQASTLASNRSTRCISLLPNLMVRGVLLEAPIGALKVDDRAA